VGVELPAVQSGLLDVHNESEGDAIVEEPPLVSEAPTRLVIPGLATGDGEPEVIAATVEPTRDIVEPTVQIPLTVQPSGNPGVFAPSDIIALIVQYDWPDDTAIAIADCESDFNPFAVNPQPVVLNNGVNHASGVFQLLMPLHTWRLEGASPFDAEANIRAAYGMWLTDGWGP